MRNLSTAALLCYALFAGLICRVSAQTTEFSYDGRVRSGGVPFDGNGLFKFAIVSGDGAICYWSNDGVTLTGDEPTSSVQIQVSSGFFSSIIGDETISGMAPLDPSIFNTEERVNLRVWFNDGAHGFQQLSPDRSITNPALLGLQASRAMKLYVNPVSGNDRNAGTHANRPKKTIQSAWDSVPKLVSSDVQIALANGVYREGVNLTGKLFAGGKITIEGNETTPSLVRVTGALENDETAATIQFGFSIYDQRALVLKGLGLDHFRDCLNISKNSYVEVQNCEFKQYLLNGILMENSYLIATNSDFGTSAVNGFSVGVHAPFGGFVELTSCKFHDLVADGLIIGRQAQARVGNCEFKNISTYGIWLAEGGILTFTQPASSFVNMPTAIYANMNCSVSYYVSRVNYSGVANQLTLLNSSYGTP